jgi:uncharacterized protein with gpF-like domain
VPPADPPADPGRFDEAVRAFRKRVPITGKRWADLNADEQAHAFTVANVAEARVVQEVYDAIDKAIEDGTTLQDFQAEVGAQLEEAWGGANAPRVETIFRTNVMQAYNEGRDEIFSHPAVREARPFCRVDTADDSRICPICEPLTDLVLPADDPFWATHKFPLHPGCRCITVALTPEEAEDEGVDDGTPDDAEPPVEGFGTGEDYDPDMASFAVEVADALRDKLK